MPRVKVPAGSIRHPVSEVDSELGVDHAPILAPSCPFSGNVHHGQIQHFQQAVIRGENGLGLGHLPQLAVEALNGVGGINQPPYLLGIFEIGTQIRPVVPPGTGNLRVCSHKARYDKIERWR